MSRLILFITSFILVFIVGFFIIQYAKGQRFDIKSVSFHQTGILVATSNPDAAQILINGDLKGATNSNINLAPGNYDVQIVKEGFSTWSKRLEIQTGVVTKTDAFLFSRAASLSPLTFFGASSPILSPDGTKVAWVVKENKEAPEKVGVWVIDLGSLPFGFSREAKQITDALPGTGGTLYWSQDSRNLIIERPNSRFLLDPGTFTIQGQLVNLTNKKLADLRVEWEKQETKKQDARFQKLPEEVVNLLTVKAGYIEFSPDETKILYKAKDDGTLAQNLIPALPGSSSQKQERSIKNNQTYIYDIKEDKNFLVSTNTSEENLSWFPTSRHLVVGGKDSIAIMEYDSTNRQVVWSGPYEPPNVFPTPQQDKLITLTNLGAANGETNLYMISLR